MRSSRRPDPARLLPLAAAALAAALPSALAGPSAPGAKLLLAISSYREDLGYPRIYFYRHDGAGSGAPAGGIPPGQTRSDHRPALAAGGTLCAWTQEVVGKVSQIGLWSVPEAKTVELPGLAAGTADLGPSLSAGGEHLAFSAWRRPGPGGWDVWLYDRASGKAAPPPGLNSDADDRMPALSADGRFLAFASSRGGGAGLSDIYLYDRQAGSLVPLPGLNSPASEVEPSLSGDGRFLAFVSARPDGAGQRDIYLYDRRPDAGQPGLVPLPGLNSIAPEQAPALTADGAFLAFVSERLEGAGHRDVFLYDLRRRKLLPTPGLNSARDDVDPAITSSP